MRRRFDLYLLVASGVLLVYGCQQPEVVARAEEKSVAPVNNLAGYAHWKEATKDYFQVLRETWTSCSGQTFTPTEESKVHTGFIKVYVSPEGENAMYASEAFPEGTVLVKEKYPTKTSPVSLRTYIRKREKGFNPKCGDWEFGTLDQSSVIQESGKISKCMACHANQKKLDYTFRTYLHQKSSKHPIMDDAGWTVSGDVDDLANALHEPSKK